MKTKMPISDDVREAIALRAYFIWEHEGRPDGRGAEHWARAEAEVTSELSPTKAAAAKKSAKKAPIAKAAKKKAAAPAKESSATKPAVEAPAKAAKTVKTKKAAKPKKVAPASRD